MSRPTPSALGCRREHARALGGARPVSGAAARDDAKAADAVLAVLGADPVVAHAQQSLQLHAEPETIRELGPKFALVRIHRANEHETCRVGVADPVALDMIGF